MQNNKSENLNNKAKNTNKNQNMNKNMAYPNTNYPYYPPRMPYYPMPMPYAPNMPNTNVNKNQSIQSQNKQNINAQVAKGKTPVAQPTKNVVATSENKSKNEPKQIINSETQQLYMEPKFKEYNNKITALEDSKKFSIISLILGIISVSLIFLDLPCGVIGLFFALKARHIEKNIFSTIGMITSIIGIAKSVILIVLFNLFIKIFAGIFLFVV